MSLVSKFKEELADTKTGLDGIADVAFDNPLSCFFMQL